MWVVEELQSPVKLEGAGCWSQEINQHGEERTDQTLSWLQSRVDQTSQGQSQKTTCGAAALG